MYIRSRVSECNVESRSLLCSFTSHLHGSILSC